MDKDGRPGGEQARILIVEDDEDILHLLQHHLREQGFSVWSAREGAQALSIVRRETPDLVLLDLMLPDMDGLRVCQRIRSHPASRKLPVLMLTALGQEEHRITGFQTGADDYVVKPFSPRELLLRIQSLLSRTYGEGDQLAETYVLNDLRVDAGAYRVFLHGEDLGLTTTEFLLLKALLESGERVVSREQLLERVWGFEFEGYSRTVDTHLHRLRGKLGPYASCIQTVRGRGYRFNSGKMSNAQP